MAPFATRLPALIDQLVRSLSERTAGLQDTRIYDGPRTVDDVSDDAVLVGQPGLDQQVQTSVTAEGLEPRYSETVTLPVTIASRAGDTSLSAGRERCGVLLGHLCAAAAEDLPQLGLDVVVGPTMTWMQVQTRGGSLVAVDLVLTATAL